MILINLLSNQATTCKLCMKDGIYSICNSVRSLNFEHLKDTYPRDYKCIKNRVLKDGQQNTYFKNRNLSLLRISDKEFLSCESDEEVFSKLACISGTNRLSDFFS